MKHIIIRKLIVILTTLNIYFIYTISEINDMVEKAEKIFKALGEKHRLRIINMLMSKPMCVCEITEMLDLSQSTISEHLRILKEADIVKDSKKGLWVEYSLRKSDETNRTIFSLLQEMFGDDIILVKERESAMETDRNVLCRK